MRLIRDGLWRKASLSHENGCCVEVRHHERRVEMRDSVHPAEAVLRFGEERWKSFLVGVRNEEFDRP